MEPGELIPHLFRKESGKISAVLCKTFSLEHIELAEDITGDTFMAALETWPYQGVPENPTAWLYIVAKNKTRNYLKRNKTFVGKIAVQLRDTKGEASAAIDLTERSIFDSQLEMLFALCHPSIPTEAQIGLSLRILCGFGIEEIANAFLANTETINKRLFRAREKLRAEKIPIELPAESALPDRIETVLTTLYLLYNEGYYSESQDAVLREDLCHEAIRLVELLTQHERTNLPPVNALLALMYFHASRFDARRDSGGELVLYNDQDTRLWNRDYIAKGVRYLRAASNGNVLSKYHLEAGIAYWHTVREDTEEKWENILQLYNYLLQVAYSPVAALNRTYALSKVRGKEEAIREAEKLQLTTNHYYYMLLGELYRGVHRSKAKSNFRQARSLAKTEPEREVISKKLSEL